MIILTPYNFTSAPAGPTDPNFSSVSLLLHGDGANNGTTFVDSSSANRVVTRVGNSITSTAQYKYGTASIAMDGSGDALTVPASTAFSYGSGDFTIEMWLYLNTLAGFQYLFDSGLSATFVRIQDSGYFLMYFEGASFGAIPVTLALNAWKHVAVTRSGTSVKLFYDGNAVFSGTSSATAGNSTNSLTIGNYGGLGNFGVNGYIDEFRITKGVARYTANYTPPSAAFPNS